MEKSELIRHVLAQEYIYFFIIFCLCLYNCDSTPDEITWLHNPKPTVRQWVFSVIENFANT